MRREAQILAALRDVPGVPRLYEASGADIDLPFIVTEFIDGRRLNEAVAAGDVSSADAVSIALALSDIVQALHARDSYHRDIKPDNIMITRESGTMVVHLVDYGSAYYEEDEFETLFGVELGNRFIRLPEFSSGSDPDSKRKPQSDLTMIAAVFFYALVGKKPDPIKTKRVLTRISGRTIGRSSQRRG
jgi:serine/threonine protein kinase